MPPAHLIEPVPGYRYHTPGSPFSASHQAVDIGAPTGTPVVAVCDGKVSAAGYELPGLWGGGNTIRLAAQTRGGTYADARQRNAWLGRAVEFAYCHLQGFAPGIKAGVDVHAGQTIGFVDTTSDLEHRLKLNIAAPTGPHLHFICKVGGVAYDYRRFLPSGDMGPTLFGYPNGKEPSGVATDYASSPVQQPPKDPFGNAVSAYPLDAGHQCPSGYNAGTVNPQAWGWVPGSLWFGRPVQTDGTILACVRADLQPGDPANFASGQGVAALVDTLGGIARNGAFLAGGIALVLIGAWSLLRGRS